MISSKCHSFPLNFIIISSSYCIFLVLNLHVSSNLILSFLIFLFLANFSLSSQFLHNFIPNDILLSFNFPISFNLVLGFLIFNFSQISIIFLLFVLLISPLIALKCPQAFMSFPIQFLLSNFQLSYQFQPFSQSFFTINTLIAFFFSQLFSFFTSFFLFLFSFFLFQLHIL